MSHTDHPPQTPGPGEDPPKGADHAIFSWMRSTGLRRPADGWLGGVLSGVAEKLGWDPILVRGIGVVLFILFFSPAALIYGLAWLFLPDAQGRIHAQRAIGGDYSSGFIGGAILAGIGALNIFTPNVAGWFAIFVNLAILAVVAWIIWLLVRTTPNTGAGASGARGAGSASRRRDSGGPDSPPSPQDGKPPWYPKEGSTSGHPPYGGYSSGSGYPSGGGYPSGDPAQASTGTTVVAPAETPQERAAKRRRRMVTFGLILLSIPVLVATVMMLSALGVSLSAAVLLALAGVVTILAVSHIISGLRGRRGRGFLLVALTTLMLILFAGHSGGIGGPTHAFGTFETTSTEEDVNTAFSNTTVDLTELPQRLAHAEGVDADDPDFHYTESVEVNAAFGNTVVIVPDDAAVLLSVDQAMGNIRIRTQDMDHAERGLSSEGFDFGPEDFRGTIELEVNAAFGNVTIYDETTYRETR
ncbi:PspC domain-containing protein [Nesterenkonia alba]|uniref:PspC domain-containing protein n=1 Tax=Nesterenkonia alba TaxID=515814 RepID=UPI0003B4D233|nr:PspC domain-containing protein [Nesterenkonia alba]